jgi:hypothetical protein
MQFQRNGTVLSQHNVPAADDSSQLADSNATITQR